MNQDLVIAEVAGDPTLTRKLREMGFHTGCTVQLLGRAPFDGPFVVRLHESVLALRAGEAECLWIR